MLTSQNQHVVAIVTHYFRERYSVNFLNGTLNLFKLIT